MNHHEYIAGKAVPIRRANAPSELGELLEPGVIVEMDRATAEACGALRDSSTDFEDAFEAAEDPAAFGGEEDGHEAA